FLILPIFLTASFVFWAFFWHTSPIPSPQHPFAQRFWPLNATFIAMFQSINKAGGTKWITDAISAPRIVGGTVAGLAVFGITSLFRLPALFYYGLIGGATAPWGGLPAQVIPTFFGAWLGKRYFSKRF